MQLLVSIELFRVRGKNKLFVLPRISKSFSEDLNLGHLCVISNTSVSDWIIKSCNSLHAL